MSHPSIDPADLPAPVEDTLQQQDEYGPVPVRVCGPAYVLVQPNRASAAITVPLSVTTEHALSADPKRAVAHLIADVDWYYLRTAGGTPVPWPAATPLTITHCDDVYVKRQSSDGTLSGIIEIYAD